MCNYAYSLNRKVIENIFTIICVISPIMVMYNSFGISWFIWTLLMQAPIFIWMLFKRKSIIIIREMVVLILFFTVHLIYAIILKGNFMSILQQLILLISVAIFLPNFLNSIIELKLYKWISIFSTLVIFLQIVIASKFKYYLSGALPFGNSAQTIYASAMNQGAILTMPVRPRSIFSEPSNYGIYVAVFLILFLWYETNINMQFYALSIFLSLGLLCSRSSTGILLMFLGWFGFYFKNIYKQRVDKLWIILTICIIFGMGIVTTSESFQVFLEHTFSNGGGVTGRTAGYSYAFNLDNYSILEMIFGHGVSSDYGTSTFLSGWPRMMYQFGILGISFYGILMLVFWGKGNREQKTIIFLMVLYNAFAAILYSIDIVFWWSLYFSISHIEEKIDL